MMNNLFKLLFISVVLGGLPLDSQAMTRNRYWQRECQKLMENNPPEIQIVYNFGSIGINNKLDSTQLSKMSKLRIKDGVLHGVSVLNTDISINLENNTVEQIGGSDFTCVYPKSVQIVVKHVKPTIYLESSMEPNSCLYKKTFRHELQHISYHYVLLSEYINALKRRAKNVVFDVAPLFYSKDNVPQKDLATRLYERFKSLYDVYQGDFLVYNNQLDTKENYDRETQLCQ